MSHSSWSGGAWMAGTNPDKPGHDEGKRPRRAPKRAANSYRYKSLNLGFYSASCWSDEFEVRVEDPAVALKASWPGLSGHPRNQRVKMRPRKRSGRKDLLLQPLLAEIEMCDSSLGR
jgi:hypothetical protein